MIMPQKESRKITIESSIWENDYKEQLILLWKKSGYQGK